MPLEIGDLAISLAVVIDGDRLLADRDDEDERAARLRQRGCRLLIRSARRSGARRGARRGFGCQGDGLPHAPQG